MIIASGISIVNYYFLVAKMPLPCVLNDRTISSTDDHVVDPVKEETNFDNADHLNQLVVQFVWLVDFTEVEVDDVVLFVSQELVVTIHSPTRLVALLFQTVEN